MCMSLWSGYLYKENMVPREHRMFKPMIHSFTMAKGIYIPVTCIYSTGLDVRSLESSLSKLLKPLEYDGVFMDNF